MAQPTQPQRAASSNRDADTTSMQLARATWLLVLIAKWMVRRPDGSAHVVLPAAWVDRLREVVAEQQTS